MGNEKELTVTISIGFHRLDEGKWRATVEGLPIFMYDADMVEARNKAVHAFHSVLAYVRDRDGSVLGYLEANNIPYNTAKRDVSEEVVVSEEPSSHTLAVPTYA